MVRGVEADFFQSHPRTAELVIEVAVSSPALDRENVSLYAEAGVTEYWIVFCRERQVEVYKHPENGRYQEMRSFGGDEALEFASLSIFIRLAELFPIPIQ